MKCFRLAPKCSSICARRTTPSTPKWTWPRAVCSTLSPKSSTQLSMSSSRKQRVSSSCPIFDNCHETRTQKLSVCLSACHVSLQPLYVSRIKSASLSYSSYSIVVFFRSHFHSDPGEDEIFSLTSSLRRLHAFYACHDFSHLNLWESKMYYLVHCSEDPSRRGAEMVGRRFGEKGGGSM